MKRTAAVLATLLCAGLAHRGVAQPTQKLYDQTLLVCQEDFKDKDYKAAEEGAQQLLSLATSSDDKEAALTMIAESFYRRKMVDQAREQWNKLVDLCKAESDDDTVARFGLARSYTSQGNFDKAIPELKAILDNISQDDDLKKEHDPEVHQLLNVLFALPLANAYYHTNQFDLAQDQLKQVAAVTQDIPEFSSLVLTRTAQTDMAQREFKKSLGEFQQVLNSKEDAPKLKEYAQRQIKGLNSLIAYHAGKGEVNSTIKINFLPDQKFDNEVDSAFQEATDGFALDIFILDEVQDENKP